MAEHRNMRASDADRARIAEQLRRATDEGRLLANEFDDRLGQALNARIYGELDAIVADLPCETVPAERPGRIGTLLRRRPGPVMKAAVAAGAATVVVLLATPTATHVATHVASQQAPVLAVPPTPPRQPAPAPPAPPRTPQPPIPPPRQPAVSP